MNRSFDTQLTKYAWLAALGMAALIAPPQAQADAPFIDFVTVGQPGNPSDSAVADDGTSGYGAVDYTFQIGKFEVTNDQYNRFLNAVAASDPKSLYDPLMASIGGTVQSGAAGSYSYSVKEHLGNKPVFTTFWNALRFCNWLHNGTPNGPEDNTTTEDGAYTITDTGVADNAITRNAGARFFLPNEDEWYKAAYYDPVKGVSDGYWLYPTRSDDVPQMVAVDADGNIVNPSSSIANYARFNGGGLTTVGSGGPGSESAYGAADMGVNISEWDEQVGPTFFLAPGRQVRGGDYRAGATRLKSTTRQFLFLLPDTASGYGFRVATTSSLPANIPPAISKTPDQATQVSTPTSPISFVVRDTETPAADLQVSGRAADADLVPNTNFSFGGSGVNRTVTITPAPGRTGTTTITLTVTDAGGASSSTAFSLIIGDTPVSLLTDQRQIFGAPGAVLTGPPNPTAPFAPWNADERGGQDGVFGDASQNSIVTPSLISANGGVDVSALGTFSAGSTRSTLLVTFRVILPVQYHFHGALIFEQRPFFPSAVGHVTLRSDTLGTIATSSGDPDGPGFDVLGTLAPGDYTIDFDLMAQADSGLNGHGGATYDWALEMSYSLQFPAPAQVTLQNTTPIVIPDHGPGNPYPSTIQVANFGGVIDSVTVQLNNLTHSWPGDLGFLLVAPTGENVLLMSGVGGDFPARNVTILFLESGLGANPLPASGQIYPIDFYTTTAYIPNYPFAPPAPPGSHQSGLFQFRGLVPNGTWSLYAFDDAPQDQGMLAGGWNLTINTIPNSPPTLSYLLHGAPRPLPDQSTEANVTLGPITIEVSDQEQHADKLSISGHASNPALIPDSNIVFRGGTTGTSAPGPGAFRRDVMLIPAPDQTGSATITLTVSDGLAQTSASFNLDVVAPAYEAKTFVSPGSIVIPDQGTATPYPSTIQVSGLSGAVSRVTLRLYEFTHTATHDLRLLLASPTGERAILMDHVQQYSYGVFNGIIGFDDSATSFSAELVEDRFYHPTIGFLQTLPVSNVPLPDPSPAPPYPAELGVFRAIPPNGTWSLYVVDDAAQDHGVIAGGWDLTIETSPSPTPVLSSIPDQTLPMNTVSPPLPFTVEDALTPADKLFLSATSSNPALIPDANILLSGSGTNRTVIVTPLTGQTGSAEIRISATNLTRVGASVSFAVNVTSQGAFMTFANPATITIPNQGPASPYPSTVNVTGLSGVINDVTVTLYNLSHTWPHDVGVLLVSPSGNAALLMADAGGGNPAQAVVLQFNDAAASSLTQGPLLAGTYRPTSFDSHDPFPSPAPAGPYPATLSVFNGLSPNGTWSLYVLDDAAQDHGQIADGWSLTLSTVASAGLMSLRVNPDPTDPLISVNRAARFELMAVLPNGHFSATIRSSARQGYVLQAASTGFAWQDVYTNSAPGEVTSFIEAEMSNLASRFYRLRMLEAPSASLSR